MKLEASDLEPIFSACFLETYRTILVGGGEEPLYRPSADPTKTPHEVVYREDYLASALHEVSHWCLAGASRRMLEDYGYWYAPDGRDAEQQAAFERAEARPQALEWILSDSIGFEFQLSADNLEGGFGPSRAFEAAVEKEKMGFLERGLPSRAHRFCEALRSSPANDSRSGRY